MVAREDGPVGIPFRELQAELRRRKAQREQPPQDDLMESEAPDATTRPSSVAPDVDVGKCARPALGQEDEGHTPSSPAHTGDDELAPDQQADGRAALLARIGYQVPLQAQDAQLGSLPEARQSDRLAARQRGSQRVPETRRSKVAKANASAPASSSQTMMSTTVSAIMESPDHCNAVTLSGAIPTHVQVP